MQKFSLLQVVALQKRIQRLFLWNIEIEDVILCNLMMMKCLDWKHLVFKFNTIPLYIFRVINLTQKVFCGCAEVAGWTVDRKIPVRFPAYPNRVWALWWQEGKRRLRTSRCPCRGRLGTLILVIRFMADLLRKYRGSVVNMVGRGVAEPHYVHSWPPIFSW